MAEPYAPERNINRNSSQRAMNVDNGEVGEARSYLQ
jgi:hypothetical protein